MNQLSEEYAIVLQQLSEDGGDSFGELASTLRLHRARLAHIVQALHKKGLITITRMGASKEHWLTISRRGQRFITYVWPEIQYA